MPGDRDAVGDRAARVVVAVGPRAAVIVHPARAVARLDRRNGVYPLFFSLSCAALSSATPCRFIPALSLTPFLSPSILTIRLS